MPDTADSDGAATASGGIDVRPPGRGGVDGGRFAGVEVAARTVPSERDTADIGFAGSPLRLVK